MLYYTFNIRNTHLTPEQKKRNPEENGNPSFSTVGVENIERIDQYFIVSINTYKWNTPILYLCLIRILDFKRHFSLSNNIYKLFLDLSELSKCSSKPALNKKTRALTFEEFRKAKGENRVTTLPSSKRKKEKSPGKVKIQIGIKQYQQDISLKALKGRTLPLTVDSNIDAEHLLHEAITKHSKHFRTFDSEAKYHLLYPDNTEVRRLRSSPDRFTLQKYKEELGKPFSKIYLYLCTNECLRRAEMHDLGLSDDDDNDDDMEGQPSSTFTFGIPANLPCTQDFGPNINPSSCTAVSSPALRPFHAEALSPTIPPPHAEALSPTTSSPLCSQVFDDIVVVEDKHSSKDQQNQPAPKSRQSIQPSILPFLTDDSEAQSSQITCPVCFENFSGSKIAQHADECAKRFDPIGAVSENESEGEDDGSGVNTEEYDLDESKHSSVYPTIKQIKELITLKLCPNVD